MRRLTLLIALLLTLFLTAAPALTARAEDFRTVSSPQGYQLQVPGSWQPMPAPNLGLPGSLDLLVASPDNGELAGVIIIQSPVPLSAADLTQTSQSFLNSGELQLQDAPVPVSVPNADSAVRTKVSVAHGFGEANVILAVRGQTVTILLVAGLSGELEQNPDVTTQILNSFALTP